MEPQNKKISAIPTEIARLVYYSSGGAIDISRKQFAVNANEIVHELRNHGDLSKETSKDQVALDRNSIKTALKAFYSPDVVEGLSLDTNNRNQQMSFAYAKKDTDGSYLVVIAVGGKSNPTAVPVEIFKFSNKKWNKYLISGKALGEFIYENDTNMLSTLDIEKIKKNRIIVAEFNENDFLNSHPHSLRFNYIISDSNENVKKSLDVDTKAVDEFQSDVKKAKLYLLDGKELYFKAKELYSKYQKGVANKDNYYFNTIAMFEPVKKPRREPDHISHNSNGKISSEYWYSDKGVVRGSTHWGSNISSCDWIIDNGSNTKYSFHKTNKTYGYANWTDFIQKTKLIKPNDNVTLTNFDNTVGKNEFNIDGVNYQWNSLSHTYISYGDKNAKVDAGKYSIDVEREIKTLRKQNEYLELANERMRQEFQLTHGRVTDERAAKNLATHLLKERWSGIEMSIDELANRAKFTVWLYYFVYKQ